MKTQENPIKLRVLIASRHPLFGKGLRSLLLERWGNQIEIIGLVSSIKETMETLEILNPDVVVVDYDDDEFNREEFLTRFMEGKRSLRVVLVSLKDGEEGAEAIIYDRRTMSASQIDDWLNLNHKSQSASNQTQRGDNV